MQKTKGVFDIYLTLPVANHSPTLVISKTMHLYYILCTTQVAIGL